MKFQVVQADEYSAITAMGTFATIEEADAKAKELVSLDNFDGPMATDESSKNWNSYYPIFNKGQYFGGYYPIESAEIIHVTPAGGKGKNKTEAKVETKIQKVKELKFNSFIGSIKTREGTTDMFSMIGDKKLNKFDSNYLDGKVHYFIKVV